MPANLFEIILNDWIAFWLWRFLFVVILCRCLIAMVSLSKILNYLIESSSQSFISALFVSKLIVVWNFFEDVLNSWMKQFLKRFMAFVIREEFSMCGYFSNVPLIVAEECAENHSFYLWFSIKISHWSVLSKLVWIIEQNLIISVRQCCLTVSIFSCAKYRWNYL